MPPKQLIWVSSKVWLFPNGLVLTVEAFVAAAARSEEGETPSWKTRLCVPGVPFTVTDTLCGQEIPSGSNAAYEKSSVPVNPGSGR